VGKTPGYIDASKKLCGTGGTIDGTNVYLRKGERWCGHFRLRLGYNAAATLYHCNVELLTLWCRCAIRSRSGEIATSWHWVMPISSATVPKINAACVHQTQLLHTEFHHSWNNWLWKWMAHDSIVEMLPIDEQQPSKPSHNSLPSVEARLVLARSREEFNQSLPPLVPRRSLETLYSLLRLLLEWVLILKCM